MKHIDLSCYKKSMPFFNLFDIYFKEQKINKEYFLLDNNITPSTYLLKSNIKQPKKLKLN